MADNRSMLKYAALDRIKIPTAIKLTDSFVSSMMKIAECKPFLDEILSTPLEIQLLRQAQIRAITYSNQIEGNPLDERAVTELIGSGRKKVTDRSEKEILNYKTALAYTETLAKEKKLPGPRDFCDLQRLVTRGLILDAQLGRFRTIPVSIVNKSSGVEIDKCPQPHELSFLIQDLWDWLKETEGTNPYARAFAFHFIAVAIHPFADGNGRTVRLFQHLLLLQQGEKTARYVPCETVVMRNRDRYYSSIRQCKALQSLHPMIEFMAESYATATQEVVHEAKKLFESSKRVQPKVRHQSIIELLNKHDHVKMSDLVQHLPDVPRRTLERDLVELVQNGHVVATGEKKGRQYEKPKKRVSKHKKPNVKTQRRE